MSEHTTCSCYVVEGTPPRRIITPTMEIKHCPLHAAAPDLLEACKAALRSLYAINGHIEGLDLPLDDIEAAITKAIHTSACGGLPTTRA